MTLYNLNYEVPIEKVTIDAKKVSFEKKKVAIDEEKVAFEERLNATHFTKASKRKIISLFEIYGTQVIIGRSDIAKVTGDSLTAAGKIISKMKELGLLEAVSGHGKGKYRFKV